MRLKGIDKKNNQNILYAKSVYFWSWFKKLLFYRHIFSLDSILKGSLIYFSYLIPINKKPYHPLTINFLITSYCNFKCGICSYHTNRNLALNDLDTKDIEKFILTHAKYRPLIYFSGGEPFMRHDLLDIVKITKKSGLKCGINTNAYLLDSDKIQMLIKLGIDLLIFSLYGPEEVHDEITGVKGSYNKAIENIHLFCRNKNGKTKVIINCAINQRNLDFLGEVPLIARGLGADAVKFEHLNFLSNDELEQNSKYFAQAEHSINTFITDFNDTNRLFAETLIEKLTVIKKRYGDFVFVKPDLTDAEIRSWYSNDFSSKRRCFFIWHSVFIRPDGTVVPCQFMLNYELGNIKQQALPDIFRSQKMLHLRKLLEKDLLPECWRCCKL